MERTKPKKADSRSLETVTTVPNTVVLLLCRRPRITYEMSRPEYERLLQIIPEGYHLTIRKMSTYKISEEKRKELIEQRLPKMRATRERNRQLKLIQDALRKGMVGAEEEEEEVEGEEVED